MLTTEKLRKIMPNLSQQRADECLPHLLIAMAEAEINTPLRQAGFLAQVAHESGEFKWFEELASGAAYEGRKDLGNTEIGDGKRFKGRGPIQVTGRANYRAAGKALGLNLEYQPQMAASVEVGFRIAAWYWTTRHINQLADVRDLVAMTRAINGGLNGFRERKQYYERALKTLLPAVEGK